MEGWCIVQCESRKKSRIAYADGSDCAEASGSHRKSNSGEHHFVRVDDGSAWIFLSADKNSGAASGFDDSCVDEGGLLGEKDRELINGMRSAISARNGRFIMISIVGRGPAVRGDDRAKRGSLHYRSSLPSTTGRAAR